MRVGLVLPVYPAALAAKMAATLSLVSGGRFELGVGVGGEFPAELRACGVDPAERGARTDEGLELITRLLAGTTRPARSCPRGGAGRSDHELMHPLTAAAADQVQRLLLDAGVFDGMAGHVAHACSERGWPALSADAGRLLRVDSTLEVDHI